MKFNLTKNKVLSFIATIIVLAGAFWYGGDTPDSKGVEKLPSDTEEQVVTNKENEADEKTDLTKDDEKNTEEDDEKDSVEESKKENNSEEDSELDEEDNELDKVSTEKRAETVETEKKENTKEIVAHSEKNKESTNTSKKSNDSASNNQKMEINPETGKDKYQTDPVPSDKPTPKEPEETQVNDVQSTAVLSVRADTALDNIDKVDPAIAQFIPKDGVIFSSRTITFNEGESVFDVLQREMRSAGIHMEASFTPMYNSAYVEGINNLYEFDAGELSGWMYKVNGWFPNYGASRYVLKDGDVIEWVYTCDLGRDVGDTYNSGQ